MRGPAIGSKHGRLVVVAHTGIVKTKSRYLARCECGKDVIVRGDSITMGITKSCGCLGREVLLKGNRSQKGKPKKYQRLAKAHPLYAVWNCMRQRCNSPTNKHYEDYGGRGIRVCERWDSFENFLADMGERPPGMTIERIDNNGNYEPRNCRWATRAEQSRNQRSTVRLEHDGRTQCLADWAREFGMDPPTLRARLVAGWDLARAIETPVRSSK